MSGDESLARLSEWTARTGDGDVWIVFDKRAMPDRAFSSEQDANDWLAHDKNAACVIYMPVWKMVRPVDG